MTTDATGTGYPPVDTADRLMSALALHPDMYATVLDALADVYEAGLDAGRAAPADAITATSNAASGWDDPLPASVYGSAGR